MGEEHRIIRFDKSFLSDVLTQVSRTHNNITDEQHIEIIELTIDDEGEYYSFDVKIIQETMH